MKAASPGADSTSFGDVAYPLHNTSIPESDIRGTLLDRQHTHGQEFTVLDQRALEPVASGQYHQSQGLGLETHPTNGHSHFGEEAFQNHATYDVGMTDYPHNAFSQSMGGESIPDLDFTNIMDQHPWDPTFDAFPLCTDCPSPNSTAIPHHHHKTGRLAGASAQLDGHFCCSWVAHGQPCFLCFGTAEALDNHIKSDHAGKDGTYRCLWQDCSKFDKATGTSQPVNFGNKPKLMRHVHSHTGYKPFPCPFPGCDKGFVTKEQLRNHETTHTKSRKFQCDQCGKAFAVKSALTTHITAVHEERKIHKCDMCGKAFADSSNLSKHKQTHFKSNGVSKRRATKREVSDGTSTRTTPSIPTPTQVPTTPNLHMSDSPATMLPPMPIAKYAPVTGAFHLPCAASNVACSSISGLSTTSSPPPDGFDPNCYCCEQNCPSPEYCCEADCVAPDGPPTPCNHDDSCDATTFCDIPECLGPSPPASGGIGYSTAVPPSDQAAPSVHHCNEQYLSSAQVDALRHFQLPDGWQEFMDSGPLQDHHQHLQSHQQKQKALEVASSNPAFDSQHAS